MDDNYLWSPSDLNTYLIEYTNYLKNKYLQIYPNYNSLHQWSVKNKELFWNSIWDFTKIKGVIKKPTIEDGINFINSKFFNNSKLNYTNNLINRKDNHDALVFYSEKNITRRITWNDLNNKVNKIANYFKKIKIKEGDRIAAVLPNIPEAVIAFLGAAKIGAIWSSCSADFGSKAVIDRFKQISPKVLIFSDYYYYNNKKIYTLHKINEIKNEIPSIKKIIIIPYALKKIDYEVKYKYENY